MFIKTSMEGIRLRGDAVRAVFQIFEKCNIRLVDHTEKMYGKNYGKPYNSEKFSKCLYRTIEGMSNLEIEDMILNQEMPIIWSRLDKFGKTEYYKPTREEIEEAKEKMKNRNK